MAQVNITKSFYCWSPAGKKQVGRHSSSRLQSEVLQSFWKNQEAVLPLSSPENMSKKKQEVISKGHGISKKQIIPLCLDAAKVMALLRMTRSSSIFPIKTLRWHESIIRCLTHMQMDVNEKWSKTKRKQVEMKK